MHTSKDQALLIRWNPFLVLDFRLDVFDRIARFDFQCDGLPGQRLHEDLHPTPQAQNQMQRRFFLNVVIRKRATVFKLFP